MASVEAEEDAAPDEPSPVVLQRIRLGAAPGGGTTLGWPDLGSTQVVVRVLWSMKKVRPFGAICILHPGGKSLAKVGWSEPVLSASPLLMEPFCSKLTEDLELPAAVFGLATSGKVVVDDLTWLSVALLTRPWPVDLVEVSVGNAEEGGGEMVGAFESGWSAVVLVGEVGYKIKMN